MNGLLHLAPAVLEKHLVPSCLRVFNCYKSSLVDRQIGDRRGRNQTEAYLPGPSRYLPCGYHLGVLEVNPKKETVCTCISDRPDFYHQIAVSNGLSAIGYGHHSQPTSLRRPSPMPSMSPTKVARRRQRGSSEEIGLLTSLRRTSR